jgi:hypothetical protein
VALPLTFPYVREFASDLGEALPNVVAFRSHHCIDKPTTRKRVRYADKMHLMSMRLRSSRHVHHVNGVARVNSWARAQREQPTISDIRRASHRRTAGNSRVALRRSPDVTL